MKKLLFVRSSSVRQSDHYPMRVMRCLSEKMIVDTVWIHEYTDYDDSGYDWLIYNSFADEGHPNKFNREMVEKADEKFYKFSGGKILLDSYDNGTLDGFARMKDKTTPRIKYTPGWEFMKEYNVIAGFPIIVRWQCKWRGEKKTIPIMYSYMHAPNTHTLRQQVREKLSGFDLYSTLHPFREYYEVLKKVKICVSVAGTGLNGTSFGFALAANAVAFTHDIIKHIQVFPFGEMIDDVNYVSFNLDNAVDRLNELLKDEDRMRRIGWAGRELYNVGYDPARSAKVIFDYIEGI